MMDLKLFGNRFRRKRRRRRRLENYPTWPKLYLCQLLLHLLWSDLRGNFSLSRTNLVECGFGPDLHRKDRESGRTWKSGRLEAACVAHLCITRWCRRCWWCCTWAGGWTMLESFVAWSGAGFVCFCADCIVFVHDPDSVINARRYIVPGGSGRFDIVLQSRSENGKQKVKKNRNKQQEFMSEERSVCCWQSDAGGPPSWVSWELRSQKRKCASAVGGRSQRAAVKSTVLLMRFYFI